MAELRKVILSACGKYRVEIVQRPCGFQMTAYRWTEELIPGYGKVYEGWERVSQMTTIADTLERAESTAAEELRSLGASPLAND